MPQVGPEGPGGTFRPVRLDKWLKVSRLVKRRTVADTLCDLGRVMIDGRVARSASPVRPGQRVLVKWGHRLTEVEVLAVPEGNLPAARAAELYRVLDGLRPEEGEDEAAHLLSSPPAAEA